MWWYIEITTVKSRLSKPFISCHSTNYLKLKHNCMYVLPISGFQGPWYLWKHSRNHHRTWKNRNWWYHKVFWLLIIPALLDITGFFKYLGTTISGRLSVSPKARKLTTWNCWTVSVSGGGADCGFGVKSEQFIYEENSHFSGTNPHSPLHDVLGLLLLLLNFIKSAFPKITKILIRWN